MQESDVDPFAVIAVFKTILTHCFSATLPISGPATVVSLNKGMQMQLIDLCEAKGIENRLELVFLFSKFSYCKDD